jgi:hypothetical protein
LPSLEIQYFFRLEDLLGDLEGKELIQMDVFLGGDWMGLITAEGIDEVEKTQ